MFKWQSVDTALLQVLGTSRFVTLITQQLHVLFAFNWRRNLWIGSVTFRHDGEK